MLDIMIDLETMGTGPNAAIIAIGAVEFDIEKNKLGERFYRVVDLTSSARQGGVMDASTVLWWMKQDESARSQFEQEGTPIGGALCGFVGWLYDNGRTAETLRMWGNGAGFDNVILSTAYERHSEGCASAPWAFYNNRCYRTMKAMFPQVALPERKGVKHNALDDAVFQAEHLLLIMQHIKAMEK